MAQFKEDDQDHFGYAYMRAACLHRTNKSDEAGDWFQRAERLTHGKRVMMTRNAQGVVKLAKWKMQKNDRALAEAERIFSSLKSDYPQYASAYFNLACVHAQQGAYDKVSKILKELRQYESAETITRYIYEDITRSSDQFLINYVTDYLKISEHPSSPRWRQLVRVALPE